MGLWEDITGKGLVWIAGPCAIESEEHALATAKKLKELSEAAGITLVYKSSYDKANRTSVDSFRGIGMEKGLKILQKVKDTYGIPVLTDVHTIEQVPKVAEVADIIQLPAFLCRQTDLAVAIGKTGKIVNVKKGQFLSPWEVQNIINKIKSTGNEKVLVTERGVSFGYNNLVSDMRSIPIIQKMGVPVCFDATHSTQMPGGQGRTSGGDREMAKVLARAALAVGVQALFTEVHENPDSAPCDGPNMIKIEDLPELLQTWKKLNAI